MVYYLIAGLCFLVGLSALAGALFSRSPARRRALFAAVWLVLWLVSIALVYTAERRGAVRPAAQTPTRSAAAASATHTPRPTPTPTPAVPAGLVAFHSERTGD
ncbi:MAG: hypothetical protein H5T60_14105, partial [Anaerolineae bacterium]|nr:hypothetical protein [Anaerolineae bacterium]